MPEKRCNGCGRQLPLSMFSKHRASRDGLQYQCKDCMKEHVARWHKSPAGKAAQDAKNASKQGRAAQRRYRKSEKGTATLEAWESSAEGREVRRKWNRSDNGKAYNAAYKQRADVKTRRLERHRERYANDPQYRIAWLFRIRILQALKGRERSGSAVALLGCSVAQAVAHIEGQFKPGMSWANHGQWHIDHKRALATFDLTDPAQAAQAFHYTNLQPLWAVENLAKGAR